VVYAQATRVPALVESRERLHYPQWSWNLSTVVAAIGALGLFVGLFIPFVGAAAVLWMVAYFVVAVLTHMSRADFQGAVPALACLVITVGLMALRWGDAAPILALVGVRSLAPSALRPG
jgi:xanthine/uracil/vitamin C permease (AzgA family)